VVAVGDTADPLIGKIKERADKLRIGPGDDPASEMGPLITKAHRDKVASYVTGAAAQGADVVIDGTGHTVQGYEDGHWIGASLLGDHPRDGNDGVHVYTRGKVGTTRWPDPADGGINLGFPRNH